MAPPAEYLTRRLWQSVGMSSIGHTLAQAVKLST